MIHGGVLLDPRSGRPVVDRDLREQLEHRGWEQVVESLERARRPIYGAERNPPLFMDVSSAYSGDELGLPYRDIMGQGIVLAADLAVTGQAGANSVNIAKGSCWVVGDTNTDLQPTYRMFNDAIVNLGISPDPAQPRRVRIVGQVTDQGFAGSGRLWALQALHGTPAASPVLPAEPASAISLADILVPAAAATSAAYTITDLRSRALIGMGSAAIAGGTVGDIFFTAASTPSSGCLLCDGSAISRTTYAALFARISTQYGVGDGSTTFNIPDGRGRVFVMLSSTGPAEVNALAGSDGRALNVRNISHYHTYTQSPGEASMASGGVSVLRNPSTQNTSGDGNNLNAPAWLVLNAQIKVT